MQVIQQFIDNKKFPEMNFSALSYAELREVMFGLKRAETEIIHFMNDTHWLCKIAGSGFRDVFDFMQGDILESIMETTGDTAYYQVVKSLFNSWGVLGWVMYHAVDRDDLPGIRNVCGRELFISSIDVFRPLGYEGDLLAYRFRMLNEYRLAWIQHMRDTINPML